MVDASSTALRGSGLAARTVTIKVRYADFSMITRSHTLPQAIDATPAIGSVAAALLESVRLDQGVRLLGVSLSGFGEAEAGIQLSLDLDLPRPGGQEARVGQVGASPEPVDPDPDERLARVEEEAERIQESWATVTSAVDAIRARYGGTSVGPASLVGADGLRVRSRGEAQWGPSAPSGPPMDDERPSSL
jgi:hypothetical protein